MFTARSQTLLMSRVLLAALAVLLGGCAGIQYTDNLPAEDLRSAANKSRTVTVQANGESWRSAGVQVESGNEYRITTSGRWNVGWGWPYSGPDGAVATPPDFTPHQIIPGFTYMALIAKVGNGSPFPVGNSYNLRPSQSGPLYFHINEGAGMCGDNDGQMRVTTTLTSHEPTATEAPHAPVKSRPAPPPPAPRVKPSQPWR